MFNIVEKFVNKLTIEDINSFALKKNIFLSEEELNFVYSFIKKNYKDILKNPNLFDINRYEDKFQNGNFEKIKKVYIEYFSKYHKFL